MPKQVAVIGGGLAGLAAAATLASKGLSVTLYETSQTLGGRARGLPYQQLTLDNGQHILLGAYQATLQLLELAGVDERVAFTRLPLTLTVHNLKTTDYFQLKATPYLPAPLHILGGLISAHGLRLRDKFRAIQLLSWMKLRQFRLSQDEPLLALLTRKRQTETLMQSLWEPLCLAALNTPLALASAQVFLNVLKDSFAQQKNDADMLIARQDLSSTLSAPLAAYIIARGGKINTGTTVDSIAPSQQGYQLQTAGQTHAYSDIIIACGPHQLKNLTPFWPQFLNPVAHLNYQPITTVYLQYSAEARLPQPMLGMVNSVGQWVFDRGQLCDQAGLMAVVISAHGPWLDKQSNLADTVSAELAQLFPQLGNPLWHKVITEKRATFSCEAQLTRPTNNTAYPNVWLAGDYTAGDYPATIEGAVRSGIEAANQLLRA